MEVRYYNIQTMSLLTLTQKSSGNTFYLDEEDVLRIYTKGSDTVIEYVTGEDHIKKSISVNETASNVYDESEVLIETSINSATVYLNYLRVVSTTELDSLAVVSYNEGSQLLIQLKLDDTVSEFNAKFPNKRGVSYRSYVAVVTQSGTDDPVDVVQIDEIGMGAWTRFFAGNYGITPTGTVDASKLAILSSSSYITSAGQAIVMETSVFAGFGFLITSQLDTSAVGTATDGLLSGGGSVTVEIRLYN